MVDSAAESACKRYSQAREIRDKFSELIDGCYEFALPLRQRTYMGNQGAPRFDRLFDGTAVTALQSFASQTLDDVWPADQTPFELKAGRGLSEEKQDEANRELAPISAMIIEMTNNSNFRSAAQEMLQDYAIGTGIMLQDEGDALRPLNFRAIPLTEAVLDTGPYGDVDALFREREVRAEHVESLWPTAKIPAALRQIIDNQGRAMVKVLEACQRDWSKRNEERWTFRVIWMQDKTLLVDDAWEGMGSCPFVAPSFTRVSGEVMGRGPVMMALPDVRTANALRELLLEHADLVLSGIWLYDDDGVLNPDTAVLEPGRLIPRAPGSRGLESVTPTAQPRLGDIEVDRLQNAIREALFVNDLGDLGKTPRSATEIMQRTADRARRLSGSYGRLMTEWLFPQVARTWWLLRKMRGQMKLPPIDGDRIKIRPLSPITRAQSQDDVLRHIRFMEIIQQFMGPQAPLLAVDTDKFAPWLAEKVGFMPHLLRPQAQQKALVQQMAALAQQQAGAQVAQP